MKKTMDLDTAHKIYKMRVQQSCSFATIATKLNMAEGEGASNFTHLSRMGATQCYLASLTLPDSLPPDVYWGIENVAQLEPDSLRAGLQEYVMDVIQYMEGFRPKENDPLDQYLLDADIWKNKADLWPVLVRVLQSMHKLDPLVVAQLGESLFSRDSVILFWHLARLIRRSLANSRS